MDVYAGGALNARVPSSLLIGERPPILQTQLFVFSKVMGVTDCYAEPPYS